MKKEGFKYLISTLLFITLGIIILSNTNLSDNVQLSKSIQVIIILFLVKISYGCIMFIRKQFDKKKYSYELVMYLGLLLFIIINLFRNINLLIINWNSLNIKDIYNHTLTSFSYFSMLTLPCIVIISLYSVITNIVLIKKEGFKYYNLLGVLLGILSIFGILSSQTIYIITKRLLSGNSQMIIKKSFDICINVAMSYFYTLIIATLYCNIKAAKHEPCYDKDYVIILGSKINDDGTLPPLLKSRVDRALLFGKKQEENANKKIYYVPSGGQGLDESMPEGLAITNYLIKQGIDSKYILIEDKSTNTKENLNYSKKIIDSHKKNAKISFSTADYHVFRSGIIANNDSIECEGMGSKTIWYFYANALIREFMASLIIEKKKHLIFLLMMIISTIILVLVGYKYNLINLYYAI